MASLFSMIFGFCLGLVMPVALLAVLRIPFAKEGAEDQASTRYTASFLALFCIFSFVFIIFFQSIFPGQRPFPWPTLLVQLSRLAVFALGVVFLLDMGVRLVKKQKLPLILADSAILCLALTAFSRGYLAFLVFSLCLLGLLFLLLLWRMVRRIRQSREGTASSLITMGVFLLFILLLVISLPSYNRVTKRSYETTNITNVYNKDGSIRYDKEGNEVLHRDVEQHKYQGTGFNATPLFCALVCYGCVFVGLYTTSPLEKKPSAPHPKRKHKP